MISFSAPSDVTAKIALVFRTNLQSSLALGAREHTGRTLRSRRRNAK